ncbi:MAG: hypothetical protein L6Q84_24185 [Polyangiaceae bacterium]|nr:hypothetical protein [Polyangiaceae bacterium]
MAQNVLFHPVAFVLNVAHPVELASVEHLACEVAKLDPGVGLPHDLGHGLERGVERFPRCFFGSVHAERTSVADSTWETCTMLSRGQLLD